MVQSAALIKDKDFDGKAWASTHDDSFRELIENARRSRAKPGSGEAKKEDADEQQKQDEAPAEPIQEVPSSSAEDGDAALGGNGIPLQEAIYRAYEPPGRRMIEAAGSDMLAEDLLAAREEQDRDHERAMFLHSMGAP
jgi:E3 ubiquitin-protein ligase RAD18